jgi:hypothetical protein
MPIATLFGGVGEPSLGCKEVEAIFRLGVSTVDNLLAYALIWDTKFEWANLVRSADQLLVGAGSFEVLE